MTTTRYRTIVADPPWPLVWTGGGAYRTNGRGERWLNTKFKKRLEYPTMTVEQIAALQVSDLAEAAAHLYLWAPDAFVLNGAIAAVARAWGFTPGRFLVWEKTGFGLGTFPRPQHELVLVCRRGRLPFRVRNVGSVKRWGFAYKHGARQHSQKPEGFFDLVEQASPGPYLELFARRQRLGWHTYGNEAFNHVTLEAAR